jgi:hypothetical protein
MCFYFKEQELKRHIEYVCSFASKHSEDWDWNWKQHVLIEKREDEPFLRLSATDGHAIAFSFLNIQSTGKLPWKSLETFQLLICARDLEAISKRFLLNDSKEELWLEAREIKSGEEVANRSLELWTRGYAFHLDSLLEKELKYTNHLSFEEFSKRVPQENLSDPLYLKREDLLRYVFLFSDFCGGSFSFGERSGLTLGFDFFLTKAVLSGSIHSSEGAKYAEQETLFLRLKALGDRSWEDGKFTKFMSDDTLDFIYEAWETGSENLIAREDIRDPFRVVLDATHLEKVLSFFGGETVLLGVQKEGVNENPIRMQNEKNDMITFISPMNFKASGWEKEEEIHG